MDEKLKQNFEQDKREKIQAARDEIQYIKDHPIRVWQREFQPWGGHKYTRYEPDYIDLPWKRGVYARDVWSEEQKRQKALWQEIQALEKSQPPTFQRMPSSPLSPQDIQEIHSIASHQAGMSMSEVEQLMAPPEG